MPSTTPSRPNITTSSPTTSNREYVLLDSKEQPKRYWYGYYEGTTCYWSDWEDSIIECVEAPLEYTGKKETADEYLRAIPPSWQFIYRSSVPLDPSIHPEYFI